MLRGAETIVVILLWLAVVLVAPVAVILTTGVDLGSSSGADTGGFMLPLMWFVCLLATAPWIGRRLNQRYLVAAEEAGPAMPAAAHLPRPLLDLFAEAAAIRHDLAPDRLDACITRAWELAGAVDLLAPDVHSALDRSGASLAPVHDLVARRARDERIPRTRQLANLDRALGEFQRALNRTPAGFRR